ncbi:hypothetical protein DMNBHIDG_00128 [Candidatus Methanoperedenaceae archaeon GB37]|nr:hypothetical protein DMNBHIDG_00128 [Candidatus Methanoperedenaceae archaeon GB37]
MGYEAWKTLFEDKNAFGKTILIRRVPCQVIGVLAEKGTDLAGDNLDQVVYLPLKTVIRRLLNQDYISALYLQAKEEYKPGCPERRSQKAVAQTAWAYHHGKGRF